MSDLKIDKDGELKGSAVAQLDRTLRGLDGMLCVQFCAKLEEALAAEGIEAKVAVCYDEEASEELKEARYSVVVLPTAGTPVASSVSDDDVANMELVPELFVNAWKQSTKEGVHKPC